MVGISGWHNSLSRVSNHGAKRDFDSEIKARRFAPSLWELAQKEAKLASAAHKSGHCLDSIFCLFTAVCSGGNRRTALL
jgi:hypothetical protein